MERETGPDRTVIEGNLVDVVREAVFPARIETSHGIITLIERVDKEFRDFLVPGLIDAHIHIESSLLSPSRFAEAAVPHGTTAVIADPHEIANVLGLEGIDYMVRDAAAVPLRFYFTAPSCVPATPFETSGAVLGPREVEKLLERDNFIALGELMNYPGAIRGDPDVIAKIDVARRLRKPVDGHCPLLSGEPLRAYVGLGISTDHECTTAAEALEKHALGMRVMVREGSVSKDLEALAPFARDHEFLLVSDDLLLPDLLRGHLDRSLAAAVSLGIDPFRALRAATINPARHYGLPLGLLEAGRMADIVRVADLGSFRILEVYIGGRRAAGQGRPTFVARPEPLPGRLSVRERSPRDFAVRASGPSAKVRSIGLVKDSLLTQSLKATLSVEDGLVMPDADRDILRIAVVNRYRDAPVANGFVTGFGLKDGAIAGSVAHDSHNIIAVGAGAGDVADAVNRVIREGGGFSACASGRGAILPLPVAGLMSAEPAAAVGETLDRLHAMAEAQGSTIPRPFMAMSFLSLLVIPSLKIGDRGLFDVDAFRFVEAVLPPEEAA
jgi:adenine deaminase